MIIKVKNISKPNETFEIETNERVCVGEHLGFGDSLYKVLGLIHCFDEYGMFTKIKVLVKEVTIKL